MRRVLAILDLRAFFGPIFYKEMLVAGRRSFSHWVRFASAILLAFLLWLIVSQGVMSEIRYESGAERIQAIAMVAPAIALIVGIIMATLLPIVASAMGSGTMLDEKNARTMESILATPMSAWALVASKLTSRVMQVIILALVAMPVLLAARAFGGISVGTILAFFCVAICQAIFACAVATWSSLRVERAWSAMVAGVLACVALSALPYLVLLAVGLRAPSPAVVEWLLKICFHTSPVGALVLVGSQGSAALGVEFFAGSSWIVTSLFSLLLTLGVMALTASRLRREAVGKARAKIKRGKEGKARGRLRRRGDRSRTVFLHPVAWRELRRPVIKGGLVTKIAGGIILFGLLVFLYTQVPPDTGGFHQTVIGLVFFAAMLMPLNSTTGALASEREGRTLEVLLSTPLSARSILLGKLAGAFATPLLTLQIVTLHVFVYTVVSLVTGNAVISPMIVIYTMLLGTGVSAMLGSTGLLFATIFKRNAVAMIANISLWVAFWILVPLFFGLVGALDSNNAISNTLAFVNPMILLADSLEGSVVGWNGRISNSYGETIDLGVSPVGWTILLGVWSSFAIAIGLAATWIASRILANRTLRSR